MSDNYIVVKKGSEYALYCNSSASNIRYSKKRKPLQDMADKLNRRQANGSTDEAIR